MGKSESSPTTFPTGATFASPSLSSSDNAFSGSLGEDILGPKYSYHDKVRNPKELGMSPDGNMGALAKDVKGLIAYVEILVEGGGAANKAGKPLGDRFFLKTASKEAFMLFNSSFK